MKIVIAGGTGFLGRNVAAELLREGHHLVVLTRRKDHSRLPDAPGLAYRTWGGTDAGPLTELLEGAGAVVNLAGESVAAGRWTDARKRVLVESRVGPTTAIADAIGSVRSKPDVLVNASAVGYYGNVEEGDVTESHAPGEGFLASLCVRWEAAAMKAATSGVRVVIPRIGFVLGGSGSALRKMAMPFRLFAGGPLGSGRQWFPWVHVADVAGIVRHAISSPDLRGPVNAVAPESVRMREFCLELGRTIGRPSWAPVPGFVLRIGLGELAEMLLGGQKVVPEALGQAAYRFRHPALAEALRDAMGRE